MKCDKIGLLLSHVYILEREDFKNEWIKSAIQKYDELDLNFYKVICGHGKRPEQEIVSWFDEIYWENEIHEQEIGRGHPKFCIEGFKIIKEAGCQKTLKNRAYDYITNKNIFNQELVVTEQTDLTQKIIGDLCMYGETDYLLKWWTKNKWNYDNNGLMNLYENKPEDFSQKALFGKPEQIGWKTFENFSNNFWGKDNSFHYYNGIGLRNIDEINFPQR